MTATKTVDSSLVLKWKFNTDGTIEMCILLSKKAWVGIGLGSGVLIIIIIDERRC
jgi:hypothetical protein